MRNDPTKSVEYGGLKGVMLSSQYSPNKENTRNKKSQGVLVLLHGYGANRYDLLGLAKELSWPDLDLVSLEGPCDVGALMGVEGSMRGWFLLEKWMVEMLMQPLAEVYNDDLNRLEEPETYRQSCTMIQTACHELRSCYSHVFLAGFSQGGMLAIDVWLTSLLEYLASDKKDPYLLAGVALLSTACCNPYIYQKIEAIGQANKPLPHMGIFQSHGLSDSTIAEQSWCLSSSKNPLCFFSSTVSSISIRTYNLSRSKPAIRSVVRSVSFRSKLRQDSL